MSRNKTDIRLTSQLRVLTTLAAGLVCVAVNAAQPRLVVGIMVDGLRQEYIDMLREHFGRDGFNRLLENGLVLENVDYGPGLDATAAAAVVMTGASPAVNGIPSAKIYDLQARRYRSVYDDGHTVGNYTDETLAPAALRTTTLADEARIDGAGVTMAYAVAADPEMAITLGGHAANSAVWINDLTGNWASSTLYPQFPVSISTDNRLRPLSTRLDTMMWMPADNTAAASGLPSHLTAYNFHHSFNKLKTDRLAAFKNSPLANTEVTRVAGELLRSLKLGTHDGTDVLNIAYTLTPYEYTRNAENRYELADSYMKLDAELSRLFNLVDSQAGRDGAVIFLAGTPPVNRRRRDDEQWNIPGGEFSTRKAISLLNLYLIALYGNGEWVNGFSGDTFYVNASLAKERDVDIARLRREAADLLKRMAGVDIAFTTDEILDGKAPVVDPEALRRNTVVGVSDGDVHVQLVPGWELIDDFNTPGAKSGRVSAHAATTAPAYLLIPGADPALITETVDARVIAPTVARQMRIRSPNGAASPPLRVPVNSRTAASHR